jgi:hypothetical protein
MRIKCGGGEWNGAYVLIENLFCIGIGLGLEVWSCMSMM